MPFLYEPTPLFRHKYRVPSARMAGRDYAAPGRYFVTICTKGRAPFFGHVKNGIMKLSLPGIIARHFWKSIPLYRVDFAIDAFVIMPNHIHGILVIQPDGSFDASPVETGQWPVSTFNVKNRCSYLYPGSIGSIVNQYKSACTKMIRALGYPDFAWQPRFHDRIIRTPDALENIRRYIRENPMQYRPH